MNDKLRVLLKFVDDHGVHMVLRTPDLAGAPRELRQRVIPLHDPVDALVLLSLSEDVKRRVGRVIWDPDRMLDAAFLDKCIVVTGSDLF